MIIRSINKCEYVGDTYNLHIENNHNYIANGQVVSNCHICKGGDGKKIAEIVEAFNYSPWKIGVTGSLPKDELTKMQIISALGKPVHIIKASELVEMGYATDLNVVSIFLKYPKEDIDYVRSKECRKNWNNEASYFNEHQGKMKFVLGLINSKIKKHENTIVFFRNISYGKALHEEVKKLTEHVYYIDGSIDGKIRDEIRGLIEKNDNVVLIASYKTTSTGINIKKIHNGIFGQSPGKSDVTLVQSLGRFLRQHESKDISNIYDIVDDCRYKTSYQNFMYRHFIARLDTYQKEGWFVSEKNYII
jgi:superfamily II DNA or RNA helicase